MTFPPLRHAKPPFGFSIQSHLLLLIAAVVVPMLTLVVVIAWDYGSAARRAIEASRLDAVDDLTNLLEREIQTTAGFLNGLAVYPRIQEGDPGIAPKLATVARENGIQVLGLYDRDGHVVFDSAASDGATLPSSKSVGVPEIVGGQKIFVSDLLASDGVKQGLLYVSVPCVIGGQVAFVLVGGFPPAQFQGLFAKTGLRDGWIAGIVDRTGILVARSENAEAYVGGFAKEMMVGVARGSQRAGLFENVSREGVTMENSFRRSANAGWTAFVAVPAVVVNAPLWRTAFIMSAVGLVLTLLGLVFGVLVARRIARAVHQLGYASVAFAAGDTVPLPVSSITELQDVSRSLEVTAGRRETTSR